MQTGSEIQCARKRGVRRIAMKNDNDRTSNSNESVPEGAPHYGQSPEMLVNTRHCNDRPDEALKGMSPERRWMLDNRVPTWKYGMVNMGFSQNFVFGNPVINDTDHRYLKISADVEGDDGRVSREIIATRNIQYNGQWMKLPEEKA